MGLFTEIFYLLPVNLYTKILAIFSSGLRVWHKIFKYSKQKAYQKKSMLSMLFFTKHWSMALISGSTIRDKDE